MAKTCHVRQAAVICQAMAGYDPDKTSLMPVYQPEAMAAESFFASVPGSARDLIYRWPWPDMPIDYGRQPAYPNPNPTPGSLLRLLGTVDYYPQYADDFRLVLPGGRLAWITAQNGHRIAPLTGSLLQITVEVQPGMPHRALSVVGIEQPFHPDMHSGFVRGEVEAIRKLVSPYNTCYASLLRLRVGPESPAMPNGIDVAITSQPSPEWHIGAVLGMTIADTGQGIYTQYTPDPRYGYLELPLHKQAPDQLHLPVLPPNPLLQPPFRA